MKPQGSSCWMTEERDENVRQVYNRILADKGFSVSKEEIYHLVAQSRASRFWVVPSHAKKTLYKMMYGRTIANQEPIRRRMYSEILRRVTEYMRTHRHTTFSHAVYYVVSQPAPEFYLSPSTIKRIILHS